MLITVLVIAFVSVYCAIVLFGHVLLAMAIWPDLFPKRRLRVPQHHGESAPAFESGAIPLEASPIDIPQAGVSQAGLSPRRFAA